KGRSTSPVFSISIVPMPTKFQLWNRTQTLILICSGVLLPTNPAVRADEVPKIPRFSVEYMDQSVDPGADFFRYTCGSWVKNNPVPADKARWAGFEELRERNWHLIHEILDSSLMANAPANSPTRQVGDFFASALDTNRIEQLRFQPLEKDFARI